MEEDRRFFLKLVLFFLGLIIVYISVLTVKLVYQRDSSRYTRINISECKFRKGSSPVGKDGIPEWVKPTEQVSPDWKNASSQGVVIPQPNTIDVVWLKYRMREGLWDEPSFFLAGTFDKLRVYVAEKKIYDTDTELLPDQQWKWVQFSLPEDFLGKDVFIEVTGGGYLPTTMQAIALGSRHTILPTILKKDIFPTAFAFLYLVIGFFSFLLYLQNLKNRVYIAFGFFNLTIGLLTLSDTFMVNILINAPQIWNTIGMASAWLLPVAIPLFVELLVEKEERPPVHFLWVINLAYCFVAGGGAFIISFFPHLLTGYIIIGILIYVILSVISLTVISVVLAKSARRGNKDALLFFMGFTAFASFWIVDIVLSSFVFIELISYNWGMFFFLAMIVYILFRRFNQNQRDLQEYSRNLEEKVKERTLEMEEKNEELVTTLEQLREAQEKLVMQEKLASLGALTAGIAHEIKNPLNFVNNFSDISVELLDELETEVKKRKCDDQEMGELISDLRDNIGKIVNHGKRADSIVQGMLLHSRGKPGEKRPTDINLVLDEYVNLAYHGMRAKDTSFNITLEKSFDSRLPLMNVVPQDLSRAFLNILNNACYATHLKSKKKKSGYSPMLRITTEDFPNRVEVKIWDNGDGIPDDIRDKIFNPFFTTKPAGEGTGLGLSITYDIVVQEHGGELKLLSETGKFTEFTIVLFKDKV